MVAVGPVSPESTSEAFPGPALKTIEPTPPELVTEGEPPSEVTTIEPTPTNTPAGVLFGLLLIRLATPALVVETIEPMPDAVVGR